MEPVPNQRAMGREAMFDWIEPARESEGWAATQAAGLEFGLT